jgi:hypothetical protein
MDFADVKTTQEAVDCIELSSSFEKAMIFGRAQKYDIFLKKEESILSKMYDNGRGYYVLGIIGCYAVIEANNENDEHPFTSAYLAFTERGEEKWNLTNTFWDSMEAALFHAIGCKKEGQNSKFARYAYNMVMQEG